MAIAWPEATTPFHLRIKPSFKGNRSQLVALKTNTLKINCSLMIAGYLHLTVMFLLISLLCFEKASWQTTSFINLMAIYFILNITTIWVLKFSLNWVRCLICGCKFVTGFGHLNDIWPVTPKRSNHHYHHDNNPSVNKFLLCPSRACFLFLNHKTSVAIKL